MLENFKKGRNYAPMKDEQDSCIIISRKFGFDVYIENHYIYIKKNKEKQKRGRVKQKKKKGEREKRKEKEREGRRKRERSDFKKKEKFDQGMKKGYHGVYAIFK